MIFWLVLAVSQWSWAEVPPKVLYHFGQREILQRNQGNVPQEDWDRFIMGPEGRYGLVPFRRGLYGGSNPDNLELYTNQYIGYTKIPWAMKISIKDECRTPEASSDMYSDERYVAWILAHGAEFIAAAPSECLNLQATGCHDLLMGNGIAQGAKERPCDMWLHRFLEDNRIRIVKDGAWQDSWYVRDRSCIETDPGAGAVLEMLAEMNWDWESRKSTYSGNGGYGTSTFAMLVSALAASDEVDGAMLDRLRAKTAASDIAHTFTEQGRDNPPWVKVSGPIVIDAYRRCADKEDFRVIAAELAAALQKDANRYPQSNGTVAAFDKRFQDACR